MVAQGGPGAWHPRGQGLLVAVVVLSVVALLGHGVVALTLLRGTVHPPPPAAPTAGGRSKPTATPSPSDPAGAASPSVLAPQCLVDDNPKTAASIPAGDPFGTDVTDLGTGAELQRLYAVDDRTLTPVDGAGPVRDCDRQLWDIVVSATSTQQRGWIKVLVFDADLSGSATGSATGSVSTDATNDPARWRLSLALNGLTDLDVVLDVAHELGHLFSLNPGQVATPQPPSCPTYDAGQGCLDQDAYLLQFMSATWSKTELDEYLSASGLPEGSQRDQALENFYDRHHGSFVSSYAATDPAEDFAETFSLWCALGPTNPMLPDYIEGDPTDGAKKLDWFEHGPTTVKSTFLSQCTPLRELTR